MPILRVTPPPTQTSQTALEVQRHALLSEFWVRMSYGLYLTIKIKQKQIKLPCGGKHDWQLDWAGKDRNRQGTQETHFENIRQRAGTVPQTQRE